MRASLRSWWLLRHRRTDVLLLTQRNVYILPTRAGWMFALTLLVLLIASINYQLNLGYALTFLLAGSAVVSLHLTHSTLRGLCLQLKQPSPAFAGSAVLLDVTLHSEARKARLGIGLRIATGADSGLVWCDVPALAQSQTRVSFVPDKRGRQTLPTLCVETRFPLGLFRAWAVWRPAAEVLVYPRPEAPALALPPTQAVGTGHAMRSRVEGSEHDGVRGYRRGDALNRVAWKKSARQLEAGGDLVTRDTTRSVQLEMWLEWWLGGALPPEDRLSRLTAWVLAAEKLEADYGLRLPGVDIAPAHGQAHQLQCLQALALWQ